MNKKRLSLIVGTVVLASTVTACGPRCASREESAERAEWMVERVSRQLDLNEAQQAKLEEVKAKLLAAREAATRQHEADRQEVLALLAQPALDRARAETLVQTHTRAVEARAPEIIAALGEFYDSLTAEQQQKLREQVESRMNGHHWH
jgi:Spy/CpxP family protein refolding chaperone